MRMKRALRHILFGIMLLSAVATVEGAARGWEPVRQEYASGTKPVMRDGDIEVRTAPGVLIVSTPHQVSIKVFTILGRLVNADTLGPGTSRLVLPANGVYIVKIGEVTCKVAV